MGTGCSSEKARKTRPAIGLQPTLPEPAVTAATPEETHLLGEVPVQSLNKINPKTDGSDRPAESQPATEVAGAKLVGTRNDPGAVVDGERPGEKTRNERGTVGAQTVGWREMLNNVAKIDPWEGSQRQDRPRWQEMLARTQKLVSAPRRTLPQDLIMRVLRGDAGASDIKDISQPKVIIFISSTFTDTQAERNLLMRDVYPYLRLLCRNLGLDFGTVDMRWGVREETTLDNATVSMCNREVNRCLSESCGPAFLAVLGHKYGYRNLPAKIDQIEFEEILKLLECHAENTSILRDHYLLDTNDIPAAYVLQPQPTDKTLWWATEEELQRQLRLVAPRLGPEKSGKYFISITEQEVTWGYLENQDRSKQSLCVKRTLVNYEQQRHLHRHILDLKDGKPDEEAKMHLQDLRDSKLHAQDDTDDGDVILEFDYSEDQQDACARYVMDVCDDVCEKLASRILEAYESHLHTEKDVVYEEVMQHERFAALKSEVFVGRENLLETIQKRVIARQENGKEGPLFVVHGASGSGKTALMAVVAKNIKKKAMPSATVVVTRFLGTTSGSGSARAVLYSVCRQVARVYGRDVTKVPSSYEDLISHFRTCLTYATPENPLVIFLDSLDQLSNEDFGRNLKWLSLREALPAHAHMIVSTLPGGCLDALKAHLPAENLLEVTQLSLSEGPQILEKMLATHNRTVTEKQRQVLLDAFAKCPLPLYLRLTVDIALRWHSYDNITHSDIAGDMRGLISTLFERIESRYGVVFVRHALGYVTCAKNGLSVAELEDILSCDDDVLDEIFDFWLPPFRRIPQLLWIRVRNELGMYLTERGSDGTNVYSWYHRQFWETAAARYLDQAESPFRMTAHEALADYFEGRWAGGKVWTPLRVTRAVTDLRPRMEDRQIPVQQLVLAGSRGTGRQLNKRKLSELPYHLLRLRVWERMEKTVGNLEFIEAKFEAGQGYDCRSEFLHASRDSSSRLLRAISKFIGVGLPHFLLEPEAVYQLASQQVRENEVRLLIDAQLPDTFPRKLSRDLHQGDAEDPCEMTLRGHTSGIRCCRFSPSGDVIASTSEDASVRVWDALSGAEVVTMTGLPGPVYTGLADPYHGERPCVWAAGGRLIVTGSEDGGLQVWDTNGALVKDITPHLKGVAGLAVSPDNSLLASSSKDGDVKIWSVPDFHLVASVPVGGQALACDFSPEGDKLAVSTYGYGGLSMIRVSDWSVLSTNGGFCSINICLAYSPVGNQIVTGGDDSSITVWNPDSGTAVGRMTGHRGWVWCVHYNKTGTRLLSCSSDRLIKLWDVTSQSCLASLGGHLHRVTWASFRPARDDTFVTGSLDSCLKIWDYEAVASGRLPETGSLHYSILETSPCGSYVATCQGWSKGCQFTQSQTERVEGSTADHSGFVLAVCFTPDGRRFVSVDTGHTGAYEVGAARRATVIVSDVPGGDTLGSLPVSGPCSVAASHNYIAVGSIDRTITLFTTCGLEYVKEWLVETGDHQTEGHVTDIACSPNSDIVAAATNTSVTIWNISDPEGGIKQAASPLPHLTTVREVRFSPDGQHLVSATSSGAINMWGSDSNGQFTPIHVLAKHTAGVTNIVFSQNGEYMASASVDMSMRVWDIRDGGCAAGAVFYGPVSKIGFIGKNVIAVGESTGIRRYVEFEM